MWSKKQTTTGKAFQTQGTACAKAQSKERASCLQRTTNSMTRAKVSVTM